VRHTVYRRLAYGVRFPATGWVATDRRDTMRKYLYLITEHEEPERIGKCKITDRPFTTVEKDSEGPLTVFSPEENFIDVGKVVGLGYADFESESAFEEQVGDVIRKKMLEVDEQWLEKAGVEYGSDD